MPRMCVTPHCNGTKIYVDDWNGYWVQTLLCDLVRRLNPYAVDAYDGVNLHPLEVLFVKVKTFMLQAAWTAPVTSQAYDRWSSHKVNRTASTVTLLYKL